MDAHHTTPSFDPVTTLFHAARASDVVLTVVAGKVLYDRGKHTTIDVTSARAGIEAAATSRP
jgi:5-methylthioadenosine/S-adenosylhomocysteine deaminase